MTKSKSLIFLCILLLSKGFCLNFYDKEDPDLLAEKIINEMTLEELLGQVFMLTYEDENPNSYFYNWLKDKKLGGVKIFGKNGKDAVGLGENIAKFQAIAAEQRFSIPLFVSTDQEGGWVRHVSDKTIKTAGNMAIAASNSIEDAYLAGYYIAKELKTLGINMNYAPTVDLMINTDSRIIGTRSFSSDPYLTSQLAIAFFKGHEELNVISTAKHFPGHGRCAEDSHGKLPSILIDYNTLLETDLVPYKYLINEEIPVIMSGHVNYPNISNSKDPASLSEYLLKDLLRKELGFKGVVITDDLLMYGATKQGVSEMDIPLEALKSGNDIILMSFNQRVYDHTWNKALALLKSDEDFKKQIKESVKRILLLKINYLKKDDAVPLYPDTNLIENTLPLKEAEDFTITNTLKSVTVLKNNLKPKTNDRILLVGRYKAFFDEGTNEFPKAERYFFTRQYTNLAKQKTYNKIFSLAQNYDIIIFEISDNDMLEIANRLNSYHDKMMTIVTSHVASIKKANFAATSIAIYSINDLSFKAGFQVLNGKHKGEGVLVF